MSEIVNCEYSKIIMEEPICNAFEVNRHGEIICSEENCIILKLKEQLQAKEQECEEYKKKFSRFFNIDNQECWDIAFLNDEKAKYKQALDEIEKICQIKEENSQFVLPSIWQQILDIINKAKESKQ